MFGRAFMIIIILIALSGITVAAFAISDNKNTSKQVSQQSITNNSISPVTNKNTNTIVKSNINNVKTDKHTIKDSILTPLVAKLLAKKYIKQQGTTAGTPNLIKEDGKKVYIVPVLMNKTVVGEIDIDAHSGKNLGGAGGAPTK